MRKVRIIYHVEPDGWWAESPDLPGYTAVGATFQKVRELVFEGVPDLSGEEVHIEEIMPSAKLSPNHWSGTGVSGGVSSGS